jgi:hypothetical protein
MVVKPIHSVEEFLKTFKIGDSFYSIGSINGEPIKVEGPEKIYGFLDYQLYKNKPPSKIVLLSKESAINSTSDHLIYPLRFVSDIVNSFHGAFTNRGDAQIELINRREQLKNDPVWQNQILQDKIDDAMADEDLY